jgi:hypothetical protein
LIYKNSTAFNHYISCRDYGYVRASRIQKHIYYKRIIVGGEVQLGLLGTAATNRPTVRAPGDYDDGEMGGMIIGKEIELLG